LNEIGGQEDVFLGADRALKRRNLTGRNFQFSTNLRVSRLFGGILFWRKALVFVNFGILAAQDLIFIRI